MENKIKQFIEDNNLDFSGSGSELNSNCVILAGFALYLGLDEETLLDIIIAEIDNTTDALVELRRVFKYADSKSYGTYWESEKAHLEYKF